MQNYIYKLLLAQLLFFSFICPISGTHIRAGEIIAEKIGGGNSTTYKFTLFIYRNSGVPADETTATLYFGDGSTVTSALATRIQLTPSTQQLKFEFTHSYSNSGRFTVFTYIKNRNEGVRNIPNSVNTSFYIETQIVIDPLLGSNSSPALKIPPIDKGAVGQVFIHNPGSYDPDGDSLVYELIPPKDFPDGSTQGQNVLGYKQVNDPSFSTGGCNSQILIDNKTGTITWDKPCLAGEYNIAFIVKEFRSGIQIGYLTRDMQVVIIQSTNTKPNLIVPKDTCITATKILVGTITGTDSESNIVEMSYYSGPFDIPTNKATISPLGSPQSQTEPAKLNFRWQTTCEHIRDQPYIPVFKIDDKDVSVSLVDIKTWSIQVNGPAIRGLVAVPSNDSVKLSWNTYLCRNAKSPEYYIMRKVCDETPITLDSCSKGTDGISGFEQIGIVTESSRTTFIDTNVTYGKKYCYYIYARHTAIGGGESKPSLLSCAELKNDIPFMMNVSVTATSLTNGQIFVRWKKPQDIDPALNPPPYSYLVSRKEENGVYQVISTLTNLNDTIFTDSNLHSKEKQFFYKITFRYGSANTIKFTTPEASSVWLRGISKNRKITLTWRTTSAPWQNIYPTNVFKLTTTSGFVLIGSTTGNSFDDIGQNTEPLINGNRYSYYVTTNGKFDFGCPNLTNTGLVLDSLRNDSQILTDAIPKDSLPPCPPQLKIKPIDCNITNTKVELQWTILRDIDCENTIVGTKLFYSPTSNESDYSLLKEFSSSDSTYNDETTKFLGCYKMKSYRFLENGNLIESAFSAPVCVDVSTCESFEYFELPNVFSPEPEDGINDLFVPRPTPRLVKTIVCNIYNRWGTKVFSTTDININWNGAGQPDGIYYFSINVEFDVLNPAKQSQTRKGWVQILR